MLLELHSHGLLSGHKGTKCTQKHTKDKINERREKKFGKKEQFFPLFFGRATVLMEQQKKWLYSRYKCGKHQKTGVYLGRPIHEVSLCIWKFSTSPWPGARWGTRALLLPLQPWIPSTTDPHLPSLVMDLPGHWGRAWRPAWRPSFCLHGESRWLV